MGAQQPHFENHALRPASSTATSKQIVINLPTCWRHVPILTLVGHTDTEVLERFPVVGSDTKHNDILHFATVLITSHPSSTTLHRFCNTNKKKRKVIVY
jgi:hypothetical protein